MYTGNSKIKALFFEIVSFFRLFTIKGFYSEEDFKGQADVGNRDDALFNDPADKSTREEWAAANFDDSGDIEKIKGGKTDDKLSDEEREDLDEYKQLLKEGKTEEEIEDIKKIRKESAGDDDLTDEQKREKKKQDDKAKEDKEAADKKKDGDKQDDEETVKLGKLVITLTEYKELVDKAKVHYGKEYDTMSEGMQEKVLIDRYNLVAGSKALNERNKTGEFTKKSLAELTTQLETTRETAKAEKKAFADELAAVKKQIEDNKKILEEKANDEFDDKAVRKLEIKQELAEKDNKILEKYVTDQEKELEKTIAREKKENDDLVNTINIQKLQDAYPELKTKTPIVKLWNDYGTTKGEGMDELEVAKMLRIRMALEDFYKNGGEGTIETKYKFLRLNLPKIGDEETKEEKPKKKEPMSVKEALKILEKKQAANQGNMGGGSGAGGGSGSGAKKSPENMNDKEYREGTGWEVPI